MFLNIKSKIMKQAQKYRQLSLFDNFAEGGGESLEPFETPEEEQKPKRLKGGSQNPIVFHDYESYVAKFKDGPKTTDDTYTPKDVYEAVLQYVGEVYDMTGKQVLRPFYPGGDYENAEYPENGVVIDNPPFSIFTKICKFYSERGIPFFLYGPGMTIMSVCGYCTAVVIGTSITFSNGAVINCNFATNLLDGIAATTAVRLTKLIKACPSQNRTVSLPVRAYPPELVSVSDLQTIARGNDDFAVPLNSCRIVKKVGGVDLFGNHLLTSTPLGEAKEQAAERAKEQTGKCISVQLRTAERMLVQRM